MWGKAAVGGGGDAWPVVMVPLTLESLQPVHDPAAVAFLRILELLLRDIAPDDEVVLPLTTEPLFKVALPSDRRSFETLQPLSVARPEPEVDPVADTVPPRVAFPLQQKSPLVYTSALSVGLMTLGLDPAPWLHE